MIGTTGKFWNVSPADKNYLKYHISKNLCIYGFEITYHLNRNQWTISDIKKICSQNIICYYLQVLFTDD